MDKNVQAFLNLVKAQCKKHGVKFVFSDKRYVLADTVKCNGYFDDGEMTLAVAAGQPIEQWIRILTHEYGHMTQWLDSCPAWKTFQVGDLDSEKIVTLWMDGEISLDKKQLKKHISQAREVELDCERRTLKLAKKYNLPMDLKAYARNANAYIYFWTYVGICRKWYTIGKEPYNTPEIVSLMPDTLDQNYDKIPKGVEKLFKRIVNG